MSSESSPIARCRHLPACIKETAVNWISRQEAGLSAAEEADFQTWLGADPRHAAAIAHLKPAWTVLNRPRQAGRGADLRNQVEQLARRIKRRQYAVQFTSLAAAAAIALGFFLHHSRSSSEQVYTIALRPDRQLLADGSTVEMNAGAQIETDFTRGMRGVRLVSGEALFNVTKDPARPFIVDAGRVRVRAVGTTFNVRLDPNSVDVLVTEGTVAVNHTFVDAARARAEATHTTRSSEEEAGRDRPGEDPSAGSPTAPGEFPAASLSAVEDPATAAALQDARGILLPAGHRVVMPAQSLSPEEFAPRPVSPVELANALAWRNRRVAFNGTPLAEAVELFNRNNSSCRLAVANAETGALRITGVFWTNDPEAFSRVVETSLELTTTRASNGSIVLRK